MSNRSTLTVPFDREIELNSDLQSLVYGEEKTDSLETKDSKPFRLPGQPGILLKKPFKLLIAFLESDLETPDLNKLAPRLWLVGTQNSSHISSLHDQCVRGRRIILSESPRMHLLWIRDQVFIKPLPSYLLSNAFWDRFLLSPTSPIKEPLQGQLRRAALGYMRTYYHLVKYESDFQFALENRLIPSTVTFEKFHDFIQSFAGVIDEEVSPRYLYGELRLGRINFWSKVFLGRRRYYKIHRTYGAHYARFYGPLILGFAFLTTILGALQVVLQAQPAWSEGSWRRFQGVSLLFAFTTIVVVAFSTFVPVLYISVMGLDEFIFALRALSGRRQKLAAASKLW